jgi:hypothetical protein
VRQLRGRPRLAQVDHLVNLYVIDVDHDVPTTGIDQSGRAVMMLSAFGVHTFDADDAEVVAAELETLAECVRRNVATYAEGEVTT